MQNYLLTIMYDGTNYSGWQIQPQKNTIQGNLESAIEKVFGEHCELVGSGRTDAGVSAKNQMANFVCTKKIEPNKLAKALNYYLPADISVLDAKIVDPNFNARFSAKKKTYAYYFYSSDITLPLYEKFATKIDPQINIKYMQKACKSLVGTKSFKSFVSRNSGKIDFVRTIYSAKIIKIKDNLYCFEICANGFLYNMVRIIMGTLVDAGKPNKKTNIKQIIDAQDRSLAGKTMPAKGLILKSVEYK